LHTSAVRSQFLRRALMVASAAVLAVTALEPASGSPYEPQGGSLNRSSSELPPDIFDFAVLADDDVWAVGADYEGHANPQETLAMHWDGRTWSRVPTPNPGAKENGLSGVSGTSSGDVWAVGFFWNGHGADHLLTEHWDGTSWTVVPNETPHTPGHHHDSVGFGKVVTWAPNDAWAFGYAFRYGPVAEHWNGKVWRISERLEALPPNFDTLGPLSAKGREDVWATGQGVNRPAPIAHYDGSTWSRAGSVRVKGALPGLNAIAATGPTDAWAAGDFLRIDGSGFFPLLVHWDGVHWSRVQNLPHRHLNGHLFSLAAFAVDDVWLAGDLVDGPGYLEHWDGAGWRTVHLPPGLRGDFLHLVGVAPDDIWARTSQSGQIWHWDGARWRFIG
jgi:hypothetical protein